MLRKCSCSVWKIADGVATLWSHMSPGPNTVMNNDGFAANGVMFDGTMTLVSDSDGTIHLFSQCLDA